MKHKKSAAALLIIAFIAVLFARPANAANVYFTSVNNVLMPLSAETMPISYNGSMYIPYSVFNSTELNTYAVYSSSAQAVTIFGEGAQLIYSLRDGTTYDYLGIKYNYRAIYLNGLVYIPVAFTCRYFDINYSTIYGNEYGTIIRFTNGEALDDETFSSSASVLMQSRLNDYLKSIESAAPPSASPVPSSSPLVTPPITSSPAPEYSDVEVFLSFFGLDEIYTPRILDSLAARSYSACFFVSKDDIASMPDLIRRIAGSGHGIGLICSDDTDNSYSTASKLLFDAAHISSFITAFGGDKAGEAAESSGLAFYCGANDASSLSVSAVRSQLSYSRRRADLIFLTDEAAASGLPAVLRTLNAGKYNVSRLTEAKAAAYGG